jgi:hypothetical protein
MEIQQPIAVHNKIACDGATLFELGMMYATGHSRPLNLVSAHICFNLASRQGHDRAPRLRQEIAADMSADQIAAAQRAARDCISASINEVLAAVENGVAPRRGQRNAQPCQLGDLPELFRVRGARGNSPHCIKILGQRRIWKSNQTAFV